MAEMMTVGQAERLAQAMAMHTDQERIRFEQIHKCNAELAAAIDDVLGLLGADNLTIEHGVDPRPTRAVEETTLEDMLSDAIQKAVDDQRASLARIRNVRTVVQGLRGTII